MTETPLYKKKWNDVALARFRVFFDCGGAYRVYHGDAEVTVLCGTEATPAVLFRGEDEYRHLYDLCPNSFTVYRRDDEVW